MIRPWARIAEAWWLCFHRTPIDSKYAFLVWSRTLRRVL
jgi:hypothetical protein